MPRRSQRSQYEERVIEISEITSDVPEPTYDEVTNENIARFVIPLYLDYEAGYSDQQICDMVAHRFGIDYDQRQLVELFESAEFRDLWPLDNHLEPRKAVARQFFQDLIPVALREAKNMLLDENTAPTVKLRLIDRILEQASTEPERRDDKAELVEFLQRLPLQLNQINVENINTVLPPEYVAALEAVNAPSPEKNLTGVGTGSNSDVVEGEYEDVDEN